ncbi:hypothetical protein AXG93_3986s1070 [Marchantia polymorpha subsp. ruderalis]|uniref:Uncharacterized protein n=1 Tax=Marchantia polymorpha subsp. ruderalis TaxID=1480154 RepID=A0A176VS09_MARPO|nr:hypothetical protein AXG93_3986s1070 [Marchantia polymorpha subsp. ruderalis]
MTAHSPSRPPSRSSRNRRSGSRSRSSSSSSSRGSSPEESGVVDSGDSPGVQSGRGPGLWQKVKTRYPLVDFHALPEYLRDNEYILSHYRADWPLRETILSIFSIHNETLNIWTHLIGFFLFLGLTIYTVWQMPRVEYPTLTRISTFPMFTDLNKLHSEIMACFPPIPPFVPSLFGLQPSIPEVSMPSTNNPQCIVRTIRQDLGRLMAPLMRKPATRWPFFVFLGGIAAMIATSFFPPVYYTFLCHPKWRNFYLTGISMIGVLTVLVSLTPLLQKPKYRPLRALLFFGMGVSGVIPGVHKLFSHRHEPVTLTTTTYEVFMGMFYALGAIFYATRIPERWKPGRFDLAGHSHQIFHVLVVAGAYTHYRAALLYIEWRDTHGCD